MKNKCISFTFGKKGLKVLKDDVGNYTVLRCKADYPIVLPLKIEAWCVDIELVLPLIGHARSSSDCKILNILHC